MVQEIGFSCRQCGTCCRGEDALIMVTPDEIRRILEHTGLSWDDVAEPYPGTVEVGGISCTLEWALVRQRGSCRFLEQDRCAIHSCRPWICRTYPFFLEGADLQVDVCSGLGTPLDENAARTIARDLFQRRDAERAEERRVADHLRRIVCCNAKRVLIDGDGVKILGE